MNPTTGHDPLDDLAPRRAGAPEHAAPHAAPHGAQPGRAGHAPTTAILDQLERVVVGKRGALRMILAALIAGGHVLIEDMPGLGKTIAARTLARSLSLTFGRVQMTPDLLPADLTGGSVWDERARDFVFRPGPLFAQVVLADELNRATPRTQSGLLEAMEEGAVTADGRRHALPQPFFVVATQNPIEQFGVFPLPEAQLDRFLIMIRLGYPDLEEEKAIVRAQTRSHPIDQLEPMLSAEGLAALRAEAMAVHTSEPILDYIVRIVRATRGRAELTAGASPRASLGLRSMARALALIDGEKFIRPDHVKEAAPAVLRHRLVLTPQARLAGVKPDDLIGTILSGLEAPIYDPV